MSSGEFALIISTLLTLSYASVSDLKFREVREYVWIPAAVITISINFLTGNYNLLELFFASIPAVLVLVLSLLDMMGGADFLALLLITLAHPTVHPKPVTYLTLIYSLVIPVLLVLKNFVLSLKNLNHYKSVRCVSGSKSLLLILGRPMRVGDFLKSKFTYLLTIPSEHGTDSFECRKSFTMDDVYEEKLKNSIGELVKKGLLKLDDLVWVTPGLPQVVFYLFGYVAALVTPDYLIRLIIPLA